MGDQMHAVSLLLEHPAFQQGLADAQEYFLENYEAAPLTEEEMLEIVERELSRHTTERDKQVCRVTGWEPASYFRYLGFVIGTIDTGLTYAR